MPFKTKSAYNEWNRRYVRARARQEDHTRVALEDQIIHAVLKEPCHHDELSLYVHFREDEVPLATITRVVRMLIQGDVLTWGRVRKHPENFLDCTRRLDVTDRARELFAPPGGRSR